MEIVMKIPDYMYEDILDRYAHPNKGDGLNVLEYAIAKGTTLPKGHGNLVDYEELKNNAREYGAYAEVTLSHIKPKIIIEADKENEV